MSFLRRSNSKTETQEMRIPVPLPPVVHTPELERQRVQNLLEAGRMVVHHELSTETLAIADMAFHQAKAMSELHGLPFEEILAGLPDNGPRSKAS